MYRALDYLHNLAKENDHASEVSTKDTPKSVEAKSSVQKNKPAKGKGRGTKRKAPDSDSDDDFAPDDDQDEEDSEDSEEVDSEFEPEFDLVKERKSRSSKGHFVSYLI